ncbi:MAG TPA: mechanosensitive ion channel family protein [Candidatus Bathyarchaeota archaeon]|mgnify:CR=1 FL=1|nr:mechanosensitive ion channel family protein [Candidatus Bathyarchaeota archaeon]
MVNVLQITTEQLYQILKIIATVVGTFLAITIFNKLIDRIEKSGELEKGKLVHMRRFFQIIIYATAIFLILSVLNYNITGAIAGLGIGALVVGFGLQNIIENWVSGILIMSGKTYAIGDVIRVGDLTGTVTDVALRTTKLKTYDRNEIIIPNSVLMKEKIINLTSGKQEAVASITFAIDYTVDAEKAKSIIESILKNNKKVIFNLKKKREIRFIFRNKEWTNEIEALFWINDPSNEEFIKSEISELIQKEFKNECILPPIPSLMRREYLTGQKEDNGPQTE